MKHSLITTPYFIVHTIIQVFTYTLFNILLEIFGQNLTTDIFFETEQYKSTQMIINVQAKNAF